MPLRQEIIKEIYGDYIIPTKNPGTTNNNSDSNSSSSSDKSSSATTASEQAGTPAETINKQEELYYQYKQAMQDMGLTEEDYKLLMQYFGTSRATQNMIVHSNKTALQNYIKIQRERNRIKNDPTYSEGNSGTTTSLSPVSKPGQQGNSILSDTGTGENSALREAQSYKGITSDDMKWLVAYYRGDRSKAENAIQTMDAQKLQDMIAAQKGWSGYVADEKSGDTESELVNTTGQTLNALPEGTTLEEPHWTERDFNPFDGDTFILGVGGNLIPGGGFSGDIDILMDTQGNVAIVRSGAMDYGLPSASGGIRLGMSTADNVEDLYGTFVHAGASAGELGIYGAEVSGSTQDGKIRNLTIVGQISAGGGAPLEVHAGAGNTEVIWEGTQKEFWQTIWNESSDTWSNIGDFPDEWPLDNYGGGFS